MAITIIQKKSQWEADGDIAMAMTSNVTAGSALIALTYSFEDNDYTVSSDVDGAFTNDISYRPASYRSTIWSKLDCTAGAHTISLSGGSTNSVLHVWEVAGLTATNAYDKGLGSTPTTTDYVVDPTDTDTTTQANEIVMCLVHATTPGTWSSANYDETLLANDTTYDRDSASGAKVVSATGGYGPSWLCTVGNPSEALVATYKGAADSGLSVFVYESTIVDEFNG